MELLGTGVVLPNMSPENIWFRRRVWELVEEYRHCERADCPDWCREFVSCEIDELLERLRRGLSLITDRL